MKTNNIVTLILVAFMVIFIAGCENKPALQPLPEANDINCSPEKIKAMPKEQQEEFSSLCLRRNGGFKHSIEKEW